MKNKMSGLLMEVGAEYNKEQLHGKKYFAELLEKESPEPRKVHPPELGRVISIPQVGGLHHRYERRAA